MVYSPVNPWTFPVDPSFPWVPEATVISSITQANPCVITTTAPHGYSDGLVVRVSFPFPYSSSFGMTQINGLSGPILVLSPTTFSMPINTTNFSPFTVGTTLQTPQILPIGNLANAPITDDFTQVNPVDPSSLSDVVIFQKPGLQAGGPATPS